MKNEQAGVHGPGREHGDERHEERPRQGRLFFACHHIANEATHPAAMHRTMSSAIRASEWWTGKRMSP